MDYRERWELKEYLHTQRLSQRVSLFHAVLFLLMLGYVLGFWYLQIVRGEEYALMSKNNRLRRVPLLANRGVIVDRNDEIIASTRPSINLLFNREGVEDAEPQLRRLSEVLVEPYEALADRLERARARPVFEPVLIDEDTGLRELAKIESHREQFPAVEIERSSLRSYPGGVSVAHAVGYVGEVGESQLAAADGELHQGDIVGRAGIERWYDESLRGRRGWKLVTVNSLGRQLGDSQPGAAPLDGEGLQLTIDLRLQRTLLEALGDEVGAGVFLDPRNGEILAIASTPAFDPNLFAGRIDPTTWRALVEDPRRPLHDRAIASYYAPGSTFKVMMAIAGLESGAITPNTTVRCNGSDVHYGRKFLCWKRGGHGTVDLRAALTHSCNVYFYRLGRKLGIDTIAEYGSLFGLGQPSEVDLPGEKNGVLPSTRWKRETRGEPWYAGETISVSIGQGVLAVTPLQMARMIGIVGTSGRVTRPHVVRREPGPTETLQVSGATFSLIRKALADVVERGTGQRAKLRKIRVAGKTGTAQVFKKSAGIDADDLAKEERDHAWFVGFAPVESPEIAFAVVIEHGGHGGTTAAPVARAVLEVYFNNRPEPEAGSLVAQADTIEDSGASPAPAR